MHSLGFVRPSVVRSLRLSGALTACALFLLSCGDKASSSGEVTPGGSAADSTASAGMTSAPGTSATTPNSGGTTPTSSTTPTPTQASSDPATPSASTSQLPSESTTPPTTASTPSVSTSAQPTDTGSPPTSSTPATVPSASVPQGTGGAVEPPVGVGGNDSMGAGGNPSPDPSTPMPPAHSGPWKIMPLGDSTTQATCYRARLWQILQDAGKTNIDFVGTEKDAGCSDGVPDGFDSDNEGHSCYIVSNLTDKGNKPNCDTDYMANSSDLALWFDSQSPDIVLMHFGTNDAWNGYGPDMILPAYEAIVDKLRTRNPNVRIFVAQIIPLQPDSGKDYDMIVRMLNAAIPMWAAENSTAESPIVVVDQFTDYVVASDNQADGVHPNSAGSTKIAQRWFDAIESLLQ